MTKLGEAITGFLTVRAAVRELQGVRLALERIAAAAERLAPEVQHAVIKVDQESSIHYPNLDEVVLAEAVRERMTQTLGRPPTDEEWLREFGEELAR